MSPRFYGSIVGLRPEFEAQYRVLHRHVFPGVLDRIARSNIRNYSIYLHDNILFAHLEHVGDDYAADQAAIAADETTREWWKLTDPMQVPLDERAPGDWWATLRVVHSRQSSADSSNRQSESPSESQSRRHALIASSPKLLPHDVCPALDHAAEVDVLRVFRSRERVYVYVECVDAAVPAVRHAVAKALGLTTPLREIEEVFHTDGVPGVPRGQVYSVCKTHHEPVPGPAHAAEHLRSRPDPGGVARKKVFVSGCFDLLHSGHVAFLQEAAQLGDLHVGIGSDATIHRLKGRYTVNTEDERRYMISALGCVKECRVNRGSGFLDFEEELHDLRPDVLVVNEDGHSPAKEALCRSLGIDYRVLQRIPHAGLPARATTTLRTETRIPFRIDLAGGWLDQPFVSCHCPGPVLTISIEPTIEFNDRSGMASSTRRKAIDLWHTSLPHGNPEQLARVLFGYENPPGTQEVAGSQDALGIVLPGLNRLHYDGGYWPSAIESVHDEAILSWLESRLHLVTLGPRVSSFRVLDDVRIDAAGARALADAADACWTAILARDARSFGCAFRRSFEAQVAMFPLMVDEGIVEAIEESRDGALGWKLSGAGGGGYLILVAEDPVPNTVGIKIRRRGTD